MIELVIVISLLGILFSVFATPKAAGLSTTAALDASAKQLKSDIALARERAMHSGRKQRILFNVGGSIYTFYQAAIGSDTWISLGTSLPLAKNVTLQSTTLSDAQIIFDPMAIPYEDPQSDTPSQINTPFTADETLTLERDSETKTVKVSTETGYVSIN